MTNPADLGQGDRLAGEDKHRLNTKSPVELAVEALKPFADAADNIATSIEGFKVVAVVPGGEHARAFANMQKLLTAENFRRAADTFHALAALQPLPVRQEGEERERGPTERDIEWLRDQKDKGHCGEGTMESRERYFLNDRIDRLLSVLPAKGGGNQEDSQSQSQPCTDGALPILTETQHSDGGQG